MDDSIPLEKMSTTRGFLFECIADLLNNEKYADIQFTFKDSNIRYVAHKLILSITSDVFHTMFFGSMAKSSTTNDLIEIVDISPHNFFQMLSFIYTEHVTLTNENLSEIYYAGHKYNIGQLQMACENYFFGSLNVNTVCTYLADFIHHDNLKEFCLAFIDGNIEELLEKKKLNTLNEGVLTMIIERDSLQVKESDLFKYLLEWASEICEQEDKYPSAAELKSKFSVFNFVRFPTMTSKEFGDCLRWKPDLLSSEDIGYICKYISVGLKDENLSYPIIRRTLPNIQKLYSFDVSLINNTYEYTYTFKFCVKRAVALQEFHVLVFETYVTSIILSLKIDQNWNILFSASTEDQNVVSCDPQIILLPNIQYRLQSSIQCILNTVNKCACTNEAFSGSIFEFPANLKTYIYKIGFQEETVTSFKRKYEN